MSRHNDGKNSGTAFLRHYVVEILSLYVCVLLVALQHLSGVRQNCRLPSRREKKKKKYNYNKVPLDIYSVVDP